MWSTHPPRKPDPPGSTPAPERERYTVALPVRPPEDFQHHNPPIRHVNTGHLRRFILLMQFRSAIAAERHSGIRAACILYATRRIEERLGVVLFIRESNQMLPTPAAIRLYPCAVRLLAMWDTIIEDSHARSRNQAPTDE
ncbi:LysR family transcriptional regulator [Cupriavidus agavae]|uniref:HTH lysR-type domain-containing protein n=1 Tax=Cupriavidus agavae TaxID=1001822 RepID=A0A4Q7RU82_9BURK|nr:LysR family transcriptional regulator [Cupriavidus agavae]RZT36350.1 hypothetical protein EV147_3669 [Cupriavidus agavae]